MSSSDTQIAQQLHKAETTRMLLERKNDRMRAEFEQQAIHLTRAQERIDELEVASDLKDRQLRLKTVDTQEPLRTLNKAEQSRSSGDRQLIKKLESRVKTLEEQVIKHRSFIDMVLHRLQVVVTEGESHTNIEAVIIDSLSSIVDTLNNAAQRATAASESSAQAARDAASSNSLHAGSQNAFTERAAYKGRILSLLRDELLQPLRQLEDIHSKFQKANLDALNQIDMLLTPTQKPSKSSKSPAELEMLRLKDRQTRYNLGS